MEKWIHKDIIYQGSIFSVANGEAQLDDGTHVSREMVDHFGGVAVVPVLGDSVILIRQFRIAIGKRMLELPAGRLEGEESIEYRARCELEEETGYRAGKMTLATSYYSSAGFTNERMHIFLAFDLVEVGQNLEFDEQIELVVMPLTEVSSKLARDEFDDAKTIIGLRALLASLDLQGKDSDDATSH